MESRPDSSRAVWWRKVRWHLLIACLLFIAVHLAIWLTSGRMVVEKSLTAWAMPCGLIWLGMCFALYVSVMQRRWALSLILGTIFVTYSLSGSVLFGDWLIETLEKEYYDLDPFAAEPYDVLVVLGGGTDTRADGSVQLGGSAGDRVMLAARLYHRGKAKQLVATGASITANGLDPLGEAQAAARIWQDVGIPPSAITKIGGGNTSEEMNEIAALLQQTSTERIGLVTSAWHLPRVLRLAKRKGLELIPVPAGFETRDSYGLVLALVPSAEGFQKTHLAAREYLARLVHR